MDEITLFEKQYNVAIDARDKLNDNYHKWMTFYYVANGAILVAVTSLSNKVDNYNVVLLTLAIVAIYTCITWNLSCRGYYYWSLSWIDIIMHFERKIANGDIYKMPYSMFSGDVVNRFDHKNNPLTPANISTPKLTLRFSIFAITCWALLFLYEFQKMITCLSTQLQIIIGIGFLAVVYSFILILPSFVKSRINDSHELMPFKQLREKDKQDADKIT